MSSERWRQLRSPTIPREQRKINWSDVVMEELMETNVISHRAMAVLKEDRGVPDVDPRLLIDLRHDKKLRPSVHSERIRQADVLAEAKRILKKEEQGKKIILAQNKLIESEIDKFQNHIIGLRKMNKRLERITTSTNSLAKKKTKWHHIFQSKVDPNSQCRENECLSELTDPLEPHNGPSQGTSQENQFIKQTSALPPYNCPESVLDKPCGSSLMVCGNQLNDHEIVHCKSNPISKSQQGLYRPSVFDKIHLKFMASDTPRQEPSESSIRHPSPVEDSLNLNHESQDLSSYIFTEKTHDVELKPLQFHESEENEGECSEQNFLFQKDRLDKVLGIVVGRETNEFVSNEPSAEQPKSHTVLEESASTPYKLSAPAKEGRPSLKLKISRSSEQRKLDLMSHAYTKWMAHVCNQVGPKKTEIPKVTTSKEKLIEQQRKAKENTNKALKREEKIEQVLNAIKHFKDSKISSPRKIMDKTNIRLSKSSHDIREDKQSFAVIKGGMKSAADGSCKHRLKTQKHVIAQQRAKLMEQRKQIEELKLSQLQVEREKSELETQKVLNFVLESCNGEIKAHAKTLHSSLSMVDLCPGNVFVRNMEQRAFEQRQKKQLALERRHQLEEERQKKAKEVEEQRRKEEQDIIQKKHEELQEARRAEREARDCARKERERMIVLERKAHAFSEKRILRRSLHGLKKLVALRKQQMETAENFYEKKIMQNSLTVWKEHVEMVIAARMDVADQFYRFSLLRRCFQALLQEMQEAAARLQVAEDMHELRLQERVFHCWVQFTHECHMQIVEKMKWANDLYCKNLLRRCLHCWKLLPSVAQQEREKERRKMAWRHKVQEMLPDFRPVLSTD